MLKDSELYYCKFSNKLSLQGIQAMEKETQALRGFLTREKVLLSSLKEIAGSEGREGEKNDLDANTRPGYTRAWADSPEGLRWNSALQVSSDCLLHFPFQGILKYLKSLAILQLLTRFNPNCPYAALCS